MEFIDKHDKPLTYTDLQGMFPNRIEMYNLSRDHIVVSTKAELTFKAPRVIQWIYKKFNDWGWIAVNRDLRSVVLVEDAKHQEVLTEAIFEAICQVTSCCDTGMFAEYVAIIGGPQREELYHTMHFSAGPIFEDTPQGRRIYGIPVLFVPWINGFAIIPRTELAELIS